MAEQRSDNVNTTGRGPSWCASSGTEHAAGATEVALSRAELLAAGGTVALAAIMVGTLSAALFGRQAGRLYDPDRGPCPQ